MTQPTPWVPSLVYTTYAAEHPNAPFPPGSLDTDFANLGVTLTGVLANLAVIQRDDGQLNNGFVKVPSLGTDVLNLIGGWTPRGAWVTATNYAVRDMVTPAAGSLTYVCAVAHTSSASFATDLALGRWQPVNGGVIAGVVASDVSFFSTDTVLGRSSSGAGPGQEIACTATGRSVIAQTSVGAVAALIGFGTAGTPTLGSLTLGAAGALQWSTDVILVRDGAGIVALKNGTTAQEARVYGSTTGPKYLSLKHDGTNAILDASSGTLNLGSTANVTVGKTITSYNTFATVDMGVPAIVASGRSTGQTAAVASICTFTPAVNGTFEVSLNLLVTASSSFSILGNINYRGEDNIVYTLHPPITDGLGTIAVNATNSSGAIPWLGLSVYFRAKAGTAITISTSGTFSSVTYNVEAIIRKVA